MTVHHENRMNEYAYLIASDKGKMQLCEQGTLKKGLNVTV